MLSRNYYEVNFKVTKILFLNKIDARNYHKVCQIPEIAISEGGDEIHLYVQSNLPGGNMSGVSDTGRTKVYVGSTEKLS